MSRSIQDPPKHCVEDDLLSPLLDRTSRTPHDFFLEFKNTIFNVLAELDEFMRAEKVFILMDDPIHSTDKESRDLLCIASSGEKTSRKIGRRYTSQQGMIGEVYNLCKSKIVKSPGTLQLSDSKLLEGPIKSLLFLRMRARETVLGMVILQNKKDNLGFTIRDLRLGELFSDFVSTSFQNAIDAKKNQLLSKIDDLTGLYNDRHFHAQLEVEIKNVLEKPRPLCLVFMDLDHFKAINDQHGHLVGSHTLREVGMLIRDTIRDSNATLARYGGDEYVMILPGIDLEEAVDLSDKLRKNIKEKMFMIPQTEGDGAFVNIKGVISASIGVASFFEHVPTRGTLREKKTSFIRMADQAMYQAKDLGKNTVVVATPVQ